MHMQLLLLPYTELGPFRALKVQSKLVRLRGGGGVCSLKTVNIKKSNVNKAILWISGD